MDQQLKTHVVLVEVLGLIPSTHVADKNICNSNSRDLTPSVASVDTAHTQYTCTHARKPLLCRKVCRFKTPKSYVLPVSASASPQASASFLLIWKRLLYMGLCEGPHEALCVEDVLTPVRNMYKC